ncbi:hypothetical protein [Burkholderia multivorans]|uniref:hypothetical protein n=1 Tax=Burkholderia multivorans TaxID=87883 RepID=UPI00057F9948|nr:hypothetical protein [Burkholderia multivorans]KHS09418.1 hypothetical protein BMD20_29540 [Burkholderia multivorans]KHS10385.1 hypothetical protein BMD22_28285 [Burkholderia multivorans]MDR9230038.1 hypothetical protein [Burkholderia multivorans]HDR9474403.1 hypothetical protein [Burkholderia multivorans]HDR9480245.1 hypothetical protein [Burkholderia multivorans]
MKKLMLIVTLATLVASAAASEQVPLWLETSLQDAHPRMVSLLDAAHCKYVGTLEPSVGWQITITEKTCEDGVNSRVSLIVPLRNLDAEPGYAAGSVVLAHEPK